MWVRIVRWWTTVVGGALLGAGLVLHAQVALAHQSREEVQSVFFLWRGIGQLTFVFQDKTTQTALWLNEVPHRVLVESDRGAWTLVVVGSFLALSATLMHGRSGKKARAGKGKRSK